MSIGPPPGLTADQDEEMVEADADVTESRIEQAMRLSRDNPPDTVDAVPRTSEVQSELTAEAKLARGANVPYQPTEQERLQHNLTHLPYRDWCPVCITGKGREAHHRRKTEGSVRSPLIQLDYKMPTQELKHVDNTAETAENSTGSNRCYIWTSTDHHCSTRC